MAEIMIKGYKCERCDHVWTPRNEDDRPTVCPKCKSPYWNKPRGNLVNKKLNNPKIRRK